MFLNKKSVFGCYFILIFKRIHAKDFGLNQQNWTDTGLTNQSLL